MTPDNSLGSISAIWSCNFEDAIDTIRDYDRNCIRSGPARKIDRKFGACKSNHVEISARLIKFGTICATNSYIFGGSHIYFPLTASFIFTDRI